MKTSVLFATWPAHRFARRALEYLRDFHRGLGHEVRWTNFSAKDVEEQVSGCSLAYVWNGQYSQASRLMSLLEGYCVKTVFTEVGWFPQGRFLYFDPKGVNMRSELLEIGPDWLEPADYEALDRMAESYYEGIPREDRGYVLVPLQLEYDTAVRNGGSFKHMEDFMVHCRLVFPDRDLRFRKHPKSKGAPKGQMSLKHQIRGASLVYGINSTVLIESALGGVETVAVGRSLLEACGGGRDALAALVARQVPIGTTDYFPWSRKGRGMEHLQEWA